MDALRDAGASEIEIETLLGSYPLAKSVQGRTQLLKGFGNAIVPAVAAQFILAFVNAKQSIAL